MSVCNWQARQPWAEAATGMRAHAYICRVHVVLICARVGARVGATLLSQNACRACVMRGALYGTVPNICVSFVAALAIG